jgi:hypothetical protein
MKARETRFVGNGNTWVADGHYRGWKVVCCRCGACKVITGHKGNTLPPHVITKKLTQAGWYVGRKECDDICVNCRRKPRKTIPPAEPVFDNGPALTLDSFLPRLRFCLEAAENSSNQDDIKAWIAAALRGIGQLETAIKLAEQKPPPSPTSNAARLAQYLGIDWERDDGAKIAEAVIEKFGLEKAEQIADAMEYQLKPKLDKTRLEADRDYEAWLAEVDRAHQQTINAETIPDA